MIGGIQIRGRGLGAIQHRVRQAVSPGNKRATAADVKAVLIKGNRRRALGAKDRFGQRMTPRKKPRRDGARGPVLAPHYTGSRIIRCYSVSSYYDAKGFQLRAGWTGEAFFLAYHAKKQPRRDVLGIDPETRREAFEAIRRNTVPGYKGR